MAQQMPFSPCETMDQTCSQEETSVGILKDIFGPVIDALASGADPDTVDIGTNLLPVLFEYFNSGLTIIAGIILFYITMVGVINTANDGETLGKNWSTPWTVVRIATGGAMLLPSSSGFSFIQILVLMISLWAVGFANSTYRLGLTQQILSPQSIVQDINESAGSYYGFDDFAQKYLKVAYCRRAANAVYAEGGQAPSRPNVRRLATPDREEVAGGTTTQVFEVRDRSEETNLAAGRPFCGIVKLSRYQQQVRNNAATTASGERRFALANSEALSNALEAIRDGIHNEKLQLATQLMTRIDQFAEGLPADLNTNGWGQASSSELNNIVREFDDLLMQRLRTRMVEGDGQVATAVGSLLDAISRGGWAEAGGWFQRIGMIRTGLSESISQSTFDVTPPHFSGLPADDRATLLARSVHLGINALLYEATLAPSPNGQGAAGVGRPAPPTISNIISVQGGEDMSADQIRAAMDQKLSSWSGDLSKYVIEVATGANGNGQTPLCGSAGNLGGSLMRMKCVGDALVLARTSVMAFDFSLMTGVAMARTGATTVVNAIPLIGSIFGETVKTAGDAIWDWFASVLSPQLKQVVDSIEPVAFLFSIVLPSLPYFIFMMVVAGWLLAVLQTMVAAPLWVVMHMTPDRTFIGSQSQGYLLLLSLFVRPVLAVLGLFGSMLISDPLIDYIANGFFSVRSAVETGMSSVMVIGFVVQLATFMWWMLAFGLLLVPVLYMVFGLPQLLPGEVLKWIGAGISDLGETQAIAGIRQGMAEMRPGPLTAGGRISVGRSYADDWKARKEKAENGGNGGGGGGSAPSGVRQRLPGHGGQGVTPDNKKSN